MSITPLKREEVISVIEGRSTASRVPVFIQMWVHPETFGEREPKVYEILKQYPEDIQLMHLRIPDMYVGPPEDPEYRWVNFDWSKPATTGGLDEHAAIKDWAQLDGVIDAFPNPEYRGLCRAFQPPDGRYRVGHWWFGLFERHWSMRGMTNALTDYYAHPDEVHRLFRTLTDFYIRIIERAKDEMAVDGIITSDDLGTQTGTFFSLEVFREFFKPYYKEMIERTHELGMHFWLHACGHIDEFLPEFVDIGLDVIHPIQKGAMDQPATAQRFGGQISFWAGLDVQQVIPWGTPDEVRQEVRDMMDAFWRPNEGRLIMTAGNGINQDCTLESLEAFLNESFKYGEEIVRG